MTYDTANPTKRRARLRNALDPVSRATELLFGLIMVLTFTASLNAAEAGRVEVRLMLIAALGCNLAWGLIDAAMYLISTRGEQALAQQQLVLIRDADTPEGARLAIADALPPEIALALDEGDFDRIRAHVSATPHPEATPRLGIQDYLAALSVFLLVFVGTLPVVLPFVFLDRPEVALPVSHGIAITLLFLTGWGLAFTGDIPGASACRWWRWARAGCGCPRSGRMT